MKFRETVVKEGLKKLDDDSVKRFKVYFLD